MQLKVTGTLTDGTIKNLTAGDCSTGYSLSDDKVMTVSPDGMVIAKGNGTAEVRVTNEHASAFITFTVSLPKGEAPPP